MPKPLTYFIAGFSFLITLLIVMSKLGYGGAFLSFTMVLAIPYSICAVLATVFKNQKREEWIVLVGTILCAGLGFEGLHLAFFSSHPADPWIVMFRPLYQIALIMVFAGIAGFSLLIKRLGNDKEKKTGA